MVSLVGEVAALGDLDRVDLADQVGDRDVRRRELLAVARDRAAASRSASRRPARRRARGAHGEIGANGSSLISPPATTGIASSSRLISERAMPRLRLAALAQEDDVLAGEDGVLDLREDRVVVADDAVEDGLLGGEPCQ